MAATEATRRTRGTSRINRSSDRRGAHVATPVPPDATAEARRVTPALHVTPNVVIAARGAVRFDRRERRGTSLRSLRRFAA